MVGFDSLSHRHSPINTQPVREDTAFTHLEPQTWIHVADTHQHRCICADPQTQLPPPPAPLTGIAATPTATIKSSFTAQGVMGTSRQLGGAGGLRVRAVVPDLPGSHSAPGSGRLHSLTHPPLSPRPVTPSFLHCCLKSGHTLLQQLNPKVPPPPRTRPQEFVPC